MAITASLYNFCKTGNDVIYDVIIWVQDGNCKKMARDNFSIGALHNITKNQDNPIKTVGRHSFLSPKTPKICHKFFGDRLMCVNSVGAKDCHLPLAKAVNVKLTLGWRYRASRGQQPVINSISATIPRTRSKSTPCSSSLLCFSIITCYSLGYLLV